MPERIIQSLWIGGTLSAMEQLAIKSFMAHGHEYHLYAYGEIAGVPHGAILRDAEEIVPATKIFTFHGNGSYAIFSDFFRYELLWRHGGWWVDLDVVCLRPFDFTRSYVFASECDVEYKKSSVTSGVIKVPPRSPAIRRALKLCRGMDLDRLDWCDTGPRMIGRLVREFDLQHSVEPYETFCPLFYDHVRQLVDPESRFADLLTRAPSIYAVHLWNEMWRRYGIDKEASYPAACLYERLKARYAHP